MFAGGEEFEPLEFFSLSVGLQAAGITREICTACTQARGRSRACADLRRLRACESMRGRCLSLKIALVSCDSHGFHFCTSSSRAAHCRRDHCDTVQCNRAATVASQVGRPQRCQVVDRLNYIKIRSRRPVIYADQGYDCDMSTRRETV